MANVVAFKNRRPNVFDTDFSFGGFDSLFDDIFGNLAKPAPSNKAFRPRIEAHEQEDHLLNKAVPRLVPIPKGFPESCHGFSNPLRSDSI